MSFKPRYSLALLLMLCTVVACSIAGIVWLRCNTIIRSEVSGTLIARNGERYPTNRWFRLPLLNPSVFYDEGIPAKGMSDFSVLETAQGKFRADVELWSYEGSDVDDFRAELGVKLGDRID